jgi:hypothetical protein
MQPGTSGDETALVRRRHLRRPGGALPHASHGVPQMALMTVSPFKEVWLELAAEWTKLAQEQEAEAKPR